ncbi:MAG TPA: hypothetical protein DHV96_03505 [Lachnospiraceae bacterium]|nr:hypothetical protein [Lachnospiraceae bacterium]
MLFYLYTDAGNPKFSDYIFIWEGNGKNVGCILPDIDIIVEMLGDEVEDVIYSYKALRDVK